MLPRINRLKGKKNFESVFKEGKGFREGSLFLKIKNNNLKNSRFAFIVSKKFFSKATLRNKIKRRLKSLVYQKLKEIKKNIDAILIPYSGIEEKKFQEIKNSLDRLFKKAKII